MPIDAIRTGSQHERMRRRSGVPPCPGRRFGGFVCLAAALIAAAWLAVCSTSRAADDEEFSKEPTWALASAKSVRADVVHWLDSAKMDPAKRDAILKALWPDASEKLSGSALLERVVKTIAAVEPRSKDLLDLCAKPHEIKQVAKFPLLTDAHTPAIVRNNLRLYYGRWCAQERLYDDALEQLSTLKTTDVADPASLLFYQSVAYHWLLKKQPGLQTIAKLLERKQEIPRRYSQMAVLMQADLSALKNDSLDHIDRRMHDVENRLDQAHAGKKVRIEEDGIIASLDKLIEQKEKEQEQREAGASGGASGTHSSSPAPDSYAARANAKGDVAKRDIGHHSGWGDMKPKERAEALQDIGEEFPSHYRAVIEQYFRRAASDGSGDSDSSAEAK